MSQILKVFSSHKALLISLVFVVATLTIDEAIFSDEKQRVNPKEAITENTHAELDRLDDHLQNISNKAIVDLNRLFSRFSVNEEMPYFIFENGEVIFWSTNRFVPKYGTLEGAYIYRFLPLQSGQYIVKRKVINSAQNRVVEIYALLPVSSQVPIAQEFEESGLNSNIFGHSTFVLSGDQAVEEANVYSKEGIFLFSFAGTSRMKIDYPTYSALIFTLYLLAILSFLFAVWQYANLFDARERPWLSVGILFVGLVVVRYFMILYEYPFSIFEWTIFDAKLYAHGTWQPSLGDLLLNVLWVLIFVGYAYRLFTVRQKLQYSTSPTRVLITVLCTAITVFFFVFTLNSLLTNGQWSFDIVQDVGFPLHKVIAYVVVFLCVIMPFLSVQFLLEELSKLVYKRRVNIVLSVLLIVALLLAVLFGYTYCILLVLLVLYVIVAYNFQLSEQLELLNYNTFLYFFLAAFIWSAISLVLLNDRLEQEALLDKMSLSIDLQTENDLTAEFLLSEAKKNIQSDILVQTNISNPFSSKELIRQKVRRVYLGDYFDKYEIEVLLFNGTGKPIGNASAINFEVLKEVYAVPENSTDFEGLYFLNTQFPSQLKQYYLFCDVLRYNTVIGHVLVKLDRRKQLNNSILPQLILEQTESSGDSDKYSYAFFSSELLGDHAGHFNYNRDFSWQAVNRDLLFGRGQVLEGYLHLAFETNDEDKVLIISTPVYPLRYLITNFSLFFLFMVGLIIVIFGGSAAYANARKQGTTISAKVQLLLNFAFFLPLIMVSIVVLRLVNDTVERNLEQQYMATTQSAGENIANQLQIFLEGQNENNEYLENRISEISEYARADINLFTINGRLLATNQRLIFENELLAPYAEPKAMAGIVESGNTEQLDVETVGSLSYKSTYYGVRSREDNRLLGVLSMPFFDSQEQLDMEQREILSNILNSFTFIFVIFVVLSFLASQIITYPFTYLTQKIKSTTLTRENEPLNWPTDDEIGLMVREYNKMLQNLEKSKKELAMREKESAWREMAQQVAHEIKNPLTPMKLKLQHLKRVLNAAPALGQEFDKPIDNLLGQVETLSDIATSFSSFAKMPIPQSERMNLTEVLRKSVNLFHEDQINIRTNIPKQAVWVLGDEKLLGRIFNNLILNAAQAAKSGTVTNLLVELEETHNKARVTFNDDGLGIPAELKDKIFIPKFSTKEQGSGIGLAIAKRGVEHAGGSIWFESEEMNGTTFFLEFPLID
ncbi:histidine kinase/DNA gyrase B/HSP90-like ATPase [Roseivirga pacifica]|uniref:histidine kinase n=1 Tax=Roseivirga pacifica TaxID=1267423 RepID=A0A1I0RFY7_9BACT|nr:ATP-binding protein [Roseivirga pacifica]RKQ49528.1 histidine kinase/DNA gyrase B/HSP90-like ATPase [Roseivirga pacifica]SEW39580.1 Histidine kinase-, DNA gyrase B-, and HSP90-like ATPase [Roseivirga pacifica]